MLGISSDLQPLFVKHVIQQLVRMANSNKIIWNMKQMYLILIVSYCMKQNHVKIRHIILAHIKLI